MPEIEAKPRSKPFGSYLALGVLALCLGTSVWMVLQPGHVDPIVPYGMIVLGTGGGLTAMTAYMCDMTFGAVAKTLIDGCVFVLDALSTVLSVFCW